MPHGIILSITLILIKINKIVKVSIQVQILPVCRWLHYMLCWGKYFLTECHHQLSINIQKWVNNKGFKFSTSKTTCMHFYRLRSLHRNPILTSDNVTINISEETKYLGIIFFLIKSLPFVIILNTLKLVVKKPWIFYVQVFTLFGVW